ncbi:MAG: hypothetical protein RLZZ299_1932 [Pseudomonadota bacterium]|jgi:amphi-Trp domain-containing protein
MTERDVEQDCTRTRFVETLRRVADAVEAGEGFRIQVGGHRFVVPSDATLAIAHEAADGSEELELQLSWSSR